MKSISFDRLKQVVRENVDIILCDGPSSFGNGVEVAVLNETGGREVTIHDRLTAHEAYIEAMYRHRPALIDQLKHFAADRVRERTSERGTIGSHVTIVDTGYIKNMYVGPYAKVEGAGRLKNGTLNSHKDSPIHIGYGVIADDLNVVLRRNGGDDRVLGHFDIVNRDALVIVMKAHMGNGDFREHHVTMRT